MSIAIPSYGTIFQVDDGALNFTTVAGIKSAGSPSRSANMVEVTEHNTGSPWREKIPTLLTMDELTLELDWVATNATHSNSAANGLGALLINRTKRKFRWINNSDAGADYHQCDFYVSKIVESGPVDNVYTAQVTITPTGAPTWVTT